MPGKKKSAGKKSADTRRASPAEKKFTDDLIVRGDAVPKKTRRSKLPPGATHWVEEDQTLKRARFKLL